MKQYQLLLVLVLAAMASLFSLRAESSVDDWWRQSLVIEDYPQPRSRVMNLVITKNETTIPTLQEKNTSICFLTSVFGKWASQADRLQNVTKLSFDERLFRFYVFTNLPRLPAPGWTKIVKHYPEYRRFITQSRRPKFLGWQEPRIQQNCQVVFYMDSIGHVIGSSEDFQQAAHSILKSPIGHAQYLHRGGGGAFGEFRRVEVFGKDLDANIAASKQWLLAQSDFDRNRNCTLYENRYIGYSVNSTSFRRAAQFLWDHYSLEQDSWRDQPLWCYVLDHFNVTPIPLDHEHLFKLKTRRMGKHKHKYGDATEGDAQQARQGKTDNPKR
jgi:hypothetical protein